MLTEGIGVNVNKYFLPKIKGYKNTNTILP